MYSILLVACYGDRMNYWWLAVVGRVGVRVCVCMCVLTGRVGPGDVDVYQLRETDVMTVRIVHA